LFPPAASAMSCVRAAAAPQRRTCSGGGGLPGGAATHGSNRRERTLAHHTTALGMNQTVSSLPGPLVPARTCRPRPLLLRDIERRRTAIRLVAAVAVTAFTSRGATEDGRLPKAAVASATAPAARAQMPNQSPLAEDRDVIKAVRQAFHESVRTHGLARMRSLIRYGNTV